MNDQSKLIYGSGNCTNLMIGTDLFIGAIFSLL